MTKNTNQSPYASLQAILPRLSLASPRRDTKPAFKNEEEAHKFVDFLKSQGQDVKIQPIWAIDHSALDQTKIVGWSISAEIA